MEPYWTKTLKVNDKDYEIKLYQYSPKSIAMVSEEEFGKMFAYRLKDIGGRFNSRLTVGAGWIFRLDSQKDLTNLIKGIYTGSIEPKATSVIAPEIEDRDVDIRIFNALNEMIQLLPTEEVDRVLQEDSDSKTTVYYNRSDSTVTEGEMIYHFSSAHKTMEIYQLKIE